MRKYTKVMSAMEEISRSREFTTRALLLAATLFSVLFIVTTLAPIAHANLIDQVKDFISPDEKTTSVDSSISLAENGDFNNNQQIDSGDIVRFSYEIKNTSGKKYAYVTLKTNIVRDEINFIHNIYGVTGINDTDNALTFPNIRIEDQETIYISFDARINYFEKQDKILTTEPEIISFNKESLAKGLKKEMKIKNLSNDQINKFRNGIINTQEK